jgi:hypothetical protein
MTKETFPLTSVEQVALVVEDLHATMKRYWEDFGIGPWRVYTVEPPGLTSLKLRGEEVESTLRWALAQIGDTQYELIQPLEGPSIYKDFLAEHGEGLHHVRFGVGDVDVLDAVDAFAAAGVPILMQGVWYGIVFTYLDTEEMIGTIAELTWRPDDWVAPEPEEIYPSP